jgi:hypothetical protein
MNTSTRRTICLDFDGVVHEYKAPWAGATVIPDGVTKGFFEWADAAAEHFDLVIHSARSKEPGGCEAMMAWLYEERRKWREAGGVSVATWPVVFGFPIGKPQAVIYIDDRGLRFDGDWSAIDPKKLLAFKPWNKRESTS